MYRNFLKVFMTLTVMSVPVVSMADTPSEGGSQTAIWIVSAIIFIGIIALLIFLKKKEDRLREDIRLNPEKYFSVERRPGDTELSLTCKSCSKQYTIYVNPKDVSFIRKNRDRCPECEAGQREQMGNISGRSWWF